MHHSETRDFTIDFLKSAAILCVIVIHSCTYTDPVGSFSWIASVLWGSIVRPAVPLFLMCSGALLLPPEKDFSLKKLFTRSLPRLILSMWVWGMVYKLHYLIPARNVTAASVWQAFKEVLLFNQEFHFYYIHMTILVYLFLPVTRNFVQNAPLSLQRYGLALWFTLGILYPTLLPYWPFNLIHGFPLQYQINMTYACIGYSMLGWYLHKHPLPLHCSFILLICGFVIVFGGTLIFSHKIGSLEERFLQGMSPGVCLMATGAWGLLSALGGKLRRGRGAVLVLSKASFCVFLVHILFLHKFDDLGFTTAILPRLVSIPLIAAAALLCSMVVYGLLSKIPVVNRWLI